MKCKIMLVDDISISNIIMEKIIKMVTNDVEIYNYTNSETAYNDLPEVMPNLIFLDLNMPLMDGWQFLEQMRNDNYHNKVVVLTSSISLIDKQGALSFSNVIDFCEKPVNKSRICYYLENSAAN